MRRLRRMRRRSRSDAPPHTPCSIRYRSAYSRHGSFTGHVAHTRRAWSTPTPSEGKKNDGSRSRHYPSSIHECSASYSGIGWSSMRSVERYARGFGSRFITTIALSTRSGAYGTLLKPVALWTDDNIPRSRSTL